MSPVLPLGVPYQWRPSTQQWTAPGRDPIDGSAGFVLGVTEPTRSNTGAGTDGNTSTLTTITGNVTVVAGQTLRDTRVEGYVNLETLGRLENCYVVGPTTPTRDRPLVNVVIPSGWNGTDQAVVDHCTLQPSTSARTLGFPAAIGIKGYRVSRTKILDCIDGFTVSGGSTAPAVTVEGCYVSDMVALRPDPWGYHPATHNDILQHHGSTSSYPVSSVMLVGNSLDCRPSPGSNVTTAAIVNGSSEVSFSAIMYSRPTGAYSAMTLDRNWLRGGNQTLQCVDPTIIGTLVSTGNRWERGSSNGGSPPDGLPAVALYLSEAAMLGRLTQTDDVWITGGAASATWRTP